MVATLASAARTDSPAAGDDPHIHGRGVYQHTCNESTLDRIWRRGPGDHGLSPDRGAAKELATAVAGGAQYSRARAFAYAGAASFATSGTELRAGAICLAKPG